MASTIGGTPRAAVKTARIVEPARTLRARQTPVKPRRVLPAQLRVFAPLLLPRALLGRFLLLRAMAAEDAFEPVVRPRGRRTRRFRRQTASLAARSSTAA